MSEHGSDNGAGGSDTPWRTFKRAVPALAPGDTLLLKNGVYTSQSAGELIIDCGSSAANGTETQPIVVRAENERQAHLRGDGMAPYAVYVSRCQYWTIEGIETSAAFNMNSVYSSKGFYVAGSHHVVVRRNLVHDMNHYNGSGGIVVTGGTFSLVEENEAYNLNRDIIYAFRSKNETFRRNYCWGGTPPPRTGPDGTGGPHVCILAYQSTDSIFENNIAQNVDEGFGDTGQRNRWLGNIAISSRIAMRSIKHPNKFLSQEDSLWRNNVVVNVPGERAVETGLNGSSVLGMKSTMARKYRTATTPMVTRLSMSPVVALIAMTLNASIHPNGSEVCDDGVDNDCDASIAAADTNCQEDVACPENHIVVNPGEEHPDEFTVVAHDAQGNPVTCARVEANLEAVGCSGSRESTSRGLLLLLSGWWLASRRRGWFVRVAEPTRTS
ncbi:MAG: right-handed parallel beta-helix repeat-containing protein [Myxococcota bacterium]